MTAIQKLRAGEAALSKRHMLIGGEWVDSASREVPFQKPLDNGVAAGAFGFLILILFDGPER